MMEKTGDSRQTHLYEFEKLEGAHNDFLFIRIHKDPSQLLFEKHLCRTKQSTHFPAQSLIEQLTKDLCHRRTGMGADGLVFWDFQGEGQKDTPPDTPTHASTELGLQNSKPLTAMLSIWNADGSFAKTCGNALRCFALVLARHGLWSGNTELAVRRFPEEGSEEFARILSFEFTDALKLSGQASVSMGPCVSALQIADELAQNKVRSYFQKESVPLSIKEIWSIELANPHVILHLNPERSFTLQQLEEIAEAHGQPLKTIFRESKILDRDVNLGFLLLDKGSEPVNKSPFVVHERGAGVTQACGSGATAAAYSLLACSHLEKLPKEKLPKNELEWQFEMPGGLLLILVEENSQKSTRSTMRGPCRYVFSAKTNLTHFPTG